MNSVEAFQPNWISPPGETIKDLLTEKSITISEFSERINADIDFANLLLLGRKEITPGLAARLSDVLGVDRRFWITREAQYREDIKRVYRKISSEEENWLDSIPVKNMQDLGWLPYEKTKSKKLLHCLDYFGISSVEQWNNYCQTQQQGVRFRTSITFSQESGALAAWLRQGEILAQKIECKAFNKEKLKGKIDSIRSLTMESDPQVFVPKLVKMCAECGVAAVIAKAPKGCRASGATKKVEDNKALLMLSFRYLSDDHFWFTLFHEIGHLLLHDDVTHIEGMESEDDPHEEEANAFSRDVLIPCFYRDEFVNLDNSYRKIIKFSKKIGVSPGIVVGQMQFHGLIKPSYNNKLKIRYSWG